MPVACHTQTPTCLSPCFSDRRAQWRVTARAIALATLCLFAWPVAAAVEDSVVMQEPVITAPQGDVPEERFVPPKNEGGAFLWAVGATVVPIVVASNMIQDGNTQAVVIVSALMLGPSAGQFYAGSVGTGLAGAGIRLAGVPVGILVGSLMASNAGNEGFADLAAFLGGFVLGSGVVWLGGTVYSLVDGHRAVGRANERARREWMSRTSLVPTLVPVGDRRGVTSWAPGLAFNMSW